MPTSPYLQGCHEAMPFDVMPKGWILFLAETGHSSTPHPGIDFRPWADAGYGVICRIQHEWGVGGGCIPKPEHLDGFMYRVETLAQNSRGCDIWTVANEPNHAQEWPDVWPLEPPYVAHVYDRCRDVIDGDVLLPAVAPWNIQIGYDWIEYFARLIEAVEDVDGFALHVYSRGANPASITAPDKMDAPYGAYFNGFQTYRDWMAAIPPRYRDRPAYITETNQNAVWLDAPNTWCQEAYREINEWNQDPTHQTIRALILYRWPKYDKYSIQGKDHVIADWQKAQSEEYTWTDEPEPPDPPQEGTVINPSFEQPYEKQAGTAFVAAGWKFWFNEGDPPAEQNQGPLAMPEYKEAPIAIDPHRVAEGLSAQCWFIQYKVMDGGVRQVVPVTQGKRYYFTVEGQAWCSDSDNPHTADGELYVSLGLDPYGREDAQAQGIVWSPWQRVTANYETYASQKVEAQGGAMPVYIRAWNKWRLKHNDIYVDDLKWFEDGTDPEPPDPPDPPPTECHALTEEQVRAIVRSEIRAAFENVTGHTRFEFDT